MIDEGELFAGRYRLISQVGTGAMGVVWKAHDELLGRAVAIKQLLLHTGMSETEAEEANRRAMREGRITARLHHPYAITVYDVAEHEGNPYLIMEYLPSQSLSTVLAKRGSLAPAEVAKIGSYIAAALAAAHKAGIVHRDVKPGNVLLGEDGTAKITDFGISRAVGDGTVTTTGVMVGTPAYFAPEVAQGQEVGFPADVFSLGATLYAAVEGVPPFGRDENPLALLFRIAHSEIAPPRRSGPLTPVLARLLDRDPARRPTMQQAREALVAAALARAVRPLPMAPTSGTPVAPTPDTPVAASGSASSDLPHSSAPGQFVPAPPPRPGLPAAPVAKAAPAREVPASWRPNEEEKGDKRSRHSATVVTAVVASLVGVGIVLVAALVNAGSNTAGAGAGPPSTTRGIVHNQPAPQPLSTTNSSTGVAPIFAPSSEPEVTPRSGPGPVPSREPRPRPRPTPTPEPSPEPSSETTPPPSPEPSSETSPPPSPEPSSETSPVPTSEPSPNPGPGPGPSPEPGPAPSSDPGRSPSPGPASVPSAEPGPVSDSDLGLARSRT